jgi:hypothetical protein
MKDRPNLEQRVQALEDKLDIVQLIMSYPLALDSGAEGYCSSVWAEEGIFDRGSSEPAEHSGGYQGSYGVKTILEEMNGPAIRAARNKGLAHLMTAPHVQVNGNRAIATNYNQLVEHGTDGFITTRVSANRWELVRRNESWLIERRTLRLLDGSSEARQLLRHDLK